MIFFKILKIINSMALNNTQEIPHPAVAGFGMTNFLFGV